MRRPVTDGRRRHERGLGVQKDSMRMPPASGPCPGADVHGSVDGQRAQGGRTPGPHRPWAWSPHCDFGRAVKYFAWFRHDGPTTMTKPCGITMIAPQPLSYKPRGLLTGPPLSPLPSFLRPFRDTMTKPCGITMMAPQPLSYNYPFTKPQAKIPGRASESSDPPTLPSLLAPQPRSSLDLPSPLP